MTNTTTTGPSASLSKGRQLYALNGTHKATPARLDFNSTVCLEWVNLWTVSRRGLRVPHSGTIRRALAVYVQHLEQLGPSDVAYELGCVRRACSGSTPREEDRAAVAARLEAFTGPEVRPIDQFLFPAHVLADRKACFDRVHELEVQLCAPRSTRRKKTP